MRTAILTVAIFALLVGCQSPGKAAAGYSKETTRHRLDGTVEETIKEAWSSTGHQPTGAITPATAFAGQNGSSSSSGNAQKQTAALAAGKEMPWVGLALMGLGLGGLVLRAWMPVVPMSASIVAMALGALAWMVPGILANFWMVLAATAVLLVLYLTGFFDNNRKLKGKGK